MPRSGILATRALHVRDRLGDQAFKHGDVQVRQLAEIQARLAHPVLAQLRQQRPGRVLAVEVHDQLAAAELGLVYVPTEDWFVVDGSVMPFAGTTMQRTDGGHLTAEYTELIEEPLRERLELLGVVG